MFESLSDKLHDVFRKLRGQSTLSEANIAEAMREIRLALLEADVNVQIAAEFIEGVRAECVGQEVIKSVTPGQQVVKIVHDRLGQDHNLGKTCPETPARRQESAAGRR